MGVDGITKKRYGSQLHANLEDLLKRIRNGSYFPKPSRIVEIPKADGSTRPLAISCIEDKIVQEAVRRVLERIYEPHFLDCSYGFRPGRSAHQALAALDKRLLRESCEAVVDIDLKKYFNTIPHQPLGRLIQRKVRDRRFLYLLIKLLRAPILNKDGASERNVVGSPQGSILSPLLANIYLHYVLDEWFVWVNHKHFRRTAHMVRYADDVLFTFDSEVEALDFHKRLIARLSDFGLAVNEAKTRIFLHMWGQSKNRKRGVIFWRMKRQLMKHRHSKNLIPYTISIVKGYMNYFAVNDNHRRIALFLHAVKRLLFRALKRRRQKRSFNWERFQRVLDLNGYPRPGILVNLFFASKSYSMG